MTDAERIHAYLDDTLPAADVRQLWHDLDRDPALQALLAEQVALHRRIVGDATAIEPPPWIRTAVLAATMPPVLPVSPRRPTPWLRRAAVAVITSATLATTIPMSLERTAPPPTAGTVLAEAPSAMKADVPPRSTTQPTTRVSGATARTMAAPQTESSSPVQPSTHSTEAHALLSSIPPTTARAIPVAPLAHTADRPLLALDLPEPTADAMATAGPVALDLRAGTGIRTVALRVPVDAHAAVHVGVAVDERPWNVVERRTMDGRAVDRTERRSVLAVLGECSFDLERTSLTVPVALRLALGASDRGPQAGIGVHYTVVTVGAFRLSAGIDAAAAAAPTMGWAVATSVQPVIGLQVAP